MKKIYTLCIIHDHPNILLGMKKRGFGEGKWNGFGGKVEEGELVEDAAKRELFEEAGVVAKNIEQKGVLEFRWKGKPEVMEVHVFLGNGVEGEPKESDEMKPCWFPVHEIPFHAMWSDDPHWLPLLLAGKKFQGEFLFNEHNAIIDHSLKEVAFI